MLLHLSYAFNSPLAQHVQARPSNGFDLQRGMIVKQNRNQSFLFGHELNRAPQNNIPRPPKPMVMRSSLPGYFKGIETKLIKYWSPNSESQKFAFATKNSARNRLQKSLEMIDSHALLG